jgi:hypothetical protein
MLRNVGILSCCIGLASAVSGCGGSSSAVQPPPPPAFSIASISPTQAVPGSADLIVSVTGSKFEATAANRSGAVWSAGAVTTALSTTIVSSTQLTAIIPAALVKSTVHAQIYVEDLDSNGAVSAKTNAVDFDVVAPPSGTISISSISPTSVAAGGSNLTLNITGSNFDIVHAGSHQTYTDVSWCSGRSNCKILQASVISPTQLTAIVTADLITAPAMVEVSVQKWYFMDDTPFATSNDLIFVVSAGSTATIVPSADTLGPNGTRQFTATVNGFSADARWEIQEGTVGGVITSTGLYTAPAHAGNFHIIASPVNGSSESAMATVAVSTSGFTESGSMHSARSGHTATLLKDGRVLIVGGDLSAEIFNPATASFTITGSMATARAGVTATLLQDGKVLIAGGENLNGRTDTGHLPTLDTAELYEPVTGTFGETGKMSDARILHTATLLANGQVLIAGGASSAGGAGEALAGSELYDPAAGTFAAAGFMLSARAQHTATLLESGEVLIVGGWNGHRADAADDPPWDPMFAELFDTSSLSFKGSGNMSTTRIDHIAVRTRDGAVLVLGGIPSPQNVHQQPLAPVCAELYDPAAQRFSQVAGLTIARTRYTATLLPSGLVLICGGADAAGQPVSEVDLLDPATGRLTVSGGLAQPRTGHTATLLQDGRVLVTGGIDANGNNIASAELYQ